MSIVKRSLLIITFLSGMLLNSGKVHADVMSTDDNGSKKASISISYMDDADGTIPCVGAGFIICRIGYRSEDGKIYPLADEINFGENVKATGIEEEVMKAVKDGKLRNVYEGKTNEKGELKLEDIEEGIYFIKETSPASGHRASSPVIAELPYTEVKDGKEELSYELYMEIKAELIKTKDIPANKRAQGKSSAKTGDGSNAGIYIPCMVISLICLSSVLYRNRSKEDA